MAKITTMKHNDQSGSYGPYTENIIDDKHAHSLSNFLQSMRKTEGFYKHVITFDSGDQISFFNVCLNPMDWFEHKDRFKRLVQLTANPELTGLMLLSMESQQLAGVEKLVDEFYCEHSNIGHGDSVHQTA